LNAWRNNPNRTYNSYPFRNGSILDPKDEADLVRLMELPDKPALRPWESSLPFSFPLTTPRTMTGAATGGYIKGGKLNLPKFANGGLVSGKGGLITGMGSGTSDSITAGFNGSILPKLQISNNEYIMKSSTVAKYGTGFMDAINAQQLSPTTPVAQSATGNVVYNNYVTVNGTDLNKKEVADEVIMRLNKKQKENNKSNMVSY
jgi:hypothetical protein